MASGGGTVSVRVDHCLLVHEQRRRLRVCGLDPSREEPTLVRLVPEVLVQISVCDLLEGLDVVHWNQVRVHVHELDLNLLERPLREQVTLDSAECLVRVVVPGVCAGGCLHISA